MLTGLMVLLFLRDWRSVIVVVLNIPFALLAARGGLWLTGQTINLMTLGGLALAVGILVDEATVEVENIHTPDGARTASIALAVRRGNPRRPCRGCWRCSASWRCSCRRSSCKARRGRCSCRCRWPSASRWSPPISCRALRAGAVGLAAARVHLHAATRSSRIWRDGTLLVRCAFSRAATARRLTKVMRLRWGPGHGLSGRAPLAVIGLVGRGWALEIFPTVDAGQFQLRMRRPPARASSGPSSSP